MAEETEKVYQYRPKDPMIARVMIGPVIYARTREGLFEIPEKHKALADMNPNLERITPDPA